MKTKLLALIFSLFFISSVSAQVIDAGRTNGSIDVSPTGAATYTVPIAVPPGINGVVPQIALSYSSQSGNGVAGYGWNVSGISSITRVGATKFHDGFVGGVNLDANDRFALDGQRLILKSGVYGADGAEYQTENFSNLKIFQRGVYSDNIYFEVFYPDGSRSVYGYYNGSKTPSEFALSFIDNPLGFRISYYYNKDYYTNDDNTLFIAQITYGSKGEDSPINQINFEYKARLRNEQAYIGGKVLKSTRILSEINVVGNGSILRNYVLTHEEVNDLKYQRLKKIQEFTGDRSRAFEPIVFNYENTPLKWTTQTENFNIAPIVDPEFTKTVSGDFTGNGKHDFIFYNKNNKSEVSMFSDDNKIIDGKRYVDKFSLADFTDILPLTFLKYNNTINQGEGFASIYDEIDNGTLAHFQIYRTNNDPSYSSNYIVNEYNKTIKNLPLAPGYYNYLNKYTAPKKIDKEYFSGDFNGDGLTDVLVVSKPYVVKETAPVRYGQPTIKTYNAESQVYFVDLDRRITGDVSNSPIGFLARNGKPDYIFTNDFNGDGKTDIAFFKEKLVSIYTLGSDNKLTLLWETPNDNFKMKYPPVLGDYNGDGKTDILYRTDISDKRFLIFSSTGKSFDSAEGDFEFSSNTRLYANDVNSDGKTDIVSYSRYTLIPRFDGYNDADAVDIYVYHNLGISPGLTIPGFLRREKSILNVSSSMKIVPVFLNFDKSNSDLDFLLLSNNTGTFSFQQNLRKDVQLKSITQDGVTHDIIYNDLATLSKGSNADPLIIKYESGTKQTFPNVDIEKARGFKLVTALKRTFNDVTTQQVFGYKGAVSNTQGLGFLGFTENIRSTWFSDDISKKQYNITVNNPSLRGAPIQSFTTNTHNISAGIKDVVAFLPTLVLSNPVSSVQTNTATQSITLGPGFLANGTNGTFIAQISDPAKGVNDGATSVSDYISRTDYTYDTQLLPNKVYKNTRTSEATKDQLNGTNTTVAYTYDEYNNVTKEFSNFSGQGSKTVDATYENGLTAPYYIGRPKTKKTTLANNSDVFSTQEEYLYKGFLPETIKKKGNNTPFITDVIAYDAFGNVTQKTTSVSTGASRTVKNEYSPDGRFMYKQTDVEGLVTTFDDYDISTGNLKWQTNPFGKFIRSDYDDWGRLIRSTDALGVNSYRDYLKSGSDIIKTERDDTGLEKQSTINALGQEIEVKSKNVFGVWVSTSYQFDDLGRPYKQSEPAFGAAYSQSNETRYDEYGRPKNIISFTGKTTTINYERLTTSVIDFTKTTSSTKNALGQVIESTDPGGTIKNTYYANGNLKSADYAGSIQSIEYDGWGRKTKLTDPSAGVYTYTYTAFGEIWQEITPKGRTTYLYDANGKITTKRVQGVTGDATNDTYIYKYNTKKTLESLTFNGFAGNNTTYTYAYDDFLRPVQTIESNPYATFTKDLSYDNFGRLNTETSTVLSKAYNKTATKVVKNNYQNGQLLSISDNVTGVKIWEVTEINARGQVKQANLGTSIKQTNGYDIYGLPEEIRTNRTGASPAELMKLNYSFDFKLGNLKSRSNSVFGYTESFGYDDMDRLLKTDLLVNGVAMPSQTQTYDNQGRTTANNTLGTYTYNGYQQTGLKDMVPTAATYYQGRPTQQIIYNAFKSPIEIYEQGKDRISFLYNAGQDRSTMFYGGEQTDPLQRRYARHYSSDGSMEITVDKQWGVTNLVFYIGGDAYTAPAIWKEVHHNGSSSKSQNLYYLHRDYQGTILQITNAAGQVQENRLFDAWGNVVKITDGNNNVLTVFLITDRGYTGHEHLLSVGIINMNGRLYDPMLHRFLSPDNYIQDPSNTQNFNRYGYVLNNPLKYTDPSGEVFWMVPVAISAAVNVIMNGMNNMYNDRPFFEGALKAGIFGAIQGAASFGIGYAFSFATQSSAFMIGAGQALMHGGLGAVMSGLNGGDVESGFLSGALSSIVAGSIEKGMKSSVALGTTTLVDMKIAMALGGAVTGGISSVLSGGTFIDGFRNGIISAGLNHALHTVFDFAFSPGKPKPKSNFYKAFMKTKESDHFSLSAKTGYAGTGVSVGSALNNASRYMPRNTFSDMKSIVRTGKILGKAGYGLGAIGTFAKGFEAFADGRITVGESVSIGISAVSIFVPAVGIIDLGVEMTTGTSLSDRIGAGIDASYP